MATVRRVAPRRVTARAVRAPARRALSPRETQVAKGLACGLTVKEVAQDLGLSSRTIDAFRTRVYYKLAIANRTGLTAWAIRHGLIGKA